MRKVPWRPGLYRSIRTLRVPIAAERIKVRKAVDMVANERTTTVFRPGYRRQNGGSVWLRFHSAQMGLVYARPRLIPLAFVESPMEIKSKYFRV